MKSKVKVIRIATSSSNAQIEDAINAQLLKGWAYISMVVSGTNFIIVLQKRISE